MFSIFSCIMSRVTHSEPGLPMVVFERSYSDLRLLPAYSKIARTNVEFVKARLLALVQLPEHGSKLSTER